MTSVYLFKMVCERATESVRWCQNLLNMQQNKHGFNRSNYLTNKVFVSVVNHIEFRLNNNKLQQREHSIITAWMETKIMPIY